MKASKYYSFNLKKRPFQIFVLTSIVLLTLSFFSTHKNTDIDLGDTYVVISLSIIYWVLAGFLLLIWALYIFIKKRLLSKKLIWIHALATILPIVAAIICFYIDPQFKEDPQRYHSFNELQRPKKDYAVIYSLLFFISVSAQFALILNIAGGMIKRLTKKRGRVLIHDPN